MSIPRTRSPLSTKSAAILVIAVVGLAGCGGAQPASRTTTQSSGEAIFVRSCGACHKLAAAGTEGVVAKSFDVTKPSEVLVLRTLAVPPKNMPKNLLSGRDARIVAAYIAKNAGR